MRLRQGQRQSPLSLQFFLNTRKYRKVTATSALKHTLGTAWNQRTLTSENTASEKEKPPNRSAGSPLLQPTPPAWLHAEQGQKLWAGRSGDASEGVSDLPPESPPRHGSSGGAWALEHRLRAGPPKSTPWKQTPFKEALLQTHRSWEGNRQMSWGSAPWVLGGEKEKEGELGSCKLRGP